jgi:tetratricopeptide (TPR) repeat protein
MSSTSVPENLTTPTLEPENTGKPQRRRIRRWMIFSLIGLLLIIAGSAAAYFILTPQVTPLQMPTLPASLSAAQLGLANWQEYQQPLPTNPLSNPSLPSSPQATGSLALLEDAAGQALIAQSNLTRGLAYLQASVLADPDNMRYGNDYRLALRNHQMYQEEQTFFAALSKKTPGSNVSIEYSLTYVDMMRACPAPPDGLVCQAQNSYSSISILDGVLQQNPYNIIARYVRGLNDLYWPRLMRHLPQAQQDLQYAVALTRFQKSIGSVFLPDAYVALGDVFGKDGNIQAARNVWLNGLLATPTQDQALLHQRLAIPQDQVSGQENNQLRGLGVYVDTDLSVFWR